MRFLKKFAIFCSSKLTRRGKNRNFIALFSEVGKKCDENLNAFSREMKINAAHFSSHIEKGLNDIATTLRHRSGP